METNVSATNVIIKAYQLHYLGTDGNHGFGTDYEIIGNMNQYHSFFRTITMQQIPNWNYNPSANVHNNIEIPYGDISGDGIINIVDVIRLINHITGEQILTGSELERINNIELISGSITEPSTDLINVTKVIQMVEMLSFWSEYA